MRIRIDGFGTERNALLANFAKESVENWSEESKKKLRMSLGTEVTPTPKIIFTQITDAEKFKAQVLHRTLWRMSGRRKDTTTSPGEIVLSLHAMGIETPG